MTELIALLSTGKGTWAEISRLIKSQPWEKIVLITDSFGMKFQAENCTLVQVDFNRAAPQLCNDIAKGLQGKLTGFEVAVNLISGDGNTHMAVVGALMKLGCGFRLVTMTENGVQEI